MSVFYKIHDMAAEASAEITDDTDLYETTEIPRYLVSKQSYEEIAAKLRAYEKGFHEELRRARAARDILQSMRAYMTLGFLVSPPEGVLEKWREAIDEWLHEFN